MKDPQDPYAVPASLNEKDVVLESYRRDGTAEHTPIVRNGPTPYLGLQGRLSQVWFNRWTVLLILVLVRVLLMLASLNGNLGDAKVKALSACTKVEDVGSSMASMPHYLSVGVNKMTAKGITETVHGLMTILNLVLTGVQELILFVINMMTATYTCLISAAVHGGLNVSAHVVTKMTDALNSAIDPITNDISKAADGFQNTINKAWDQIDNLGDTIKDGFDDLFGGGGGGDSKAPNKPLLDLSPQINKLKDIKIDTSGFVADLNTINKELPDFDDVQNFTRQAVSFPFNLVKKALNDTYGAWKFDESVFPVARKEALSFCSDNSVISDFFENLYKIAHDAKIAFIVTLTILALLAIIPMAYMEIYRWRRQREYIKLFQARKADEVDYMIMGSRPFTSKIGLMAADKVAKTEERRYLVQWCVAYGTTWPALFVLSLAIAGFFSCLCQYFVLVAIEKEVPALTQQVGDFANQVVGNLEAVSTGWANDANGVVLSFQNEINGDVLGYVTNATGAVTDALNVFTSTMDKGLTVVFGGTIMEDPIKEVIRCLIGLKIEAVQKGIAWVHDHSQLSLPMFANDTFSAGAQKSIDDDSDLDTFLATPSSVTTDEVTGAVRHVINWLRNSIIQEALISLGLLLVYLLVVFVGVARMLASMVTASRNGYGGQQGQRHYTGDGRATPAGSPRAPYAHSFSEGPPPPHPTYGGPYAAGGPFADDNAYVGRAPRANPTTHQGHFRQSSYGETYGNKS